MKLFTCLCFAALTLTAVSGQAEVPVYRDQQLELPSAVVLTDAGPVYYGDVRFTANADGSFTLVEAKRRNLAQVDANTVAIDRSAPGQVSVAAGGVLSIACVALEEPAVVREGNTFHVALAETAMDPLALCMSFVAFTRFDVDVPLDLTGLEAGTYTVIVNGVETSFTLTEDNL